jgi:hypothetical protein
LPEIKIEEKTGENYNLDKISSPTERNNLLA